MSTSAKTEIAHGGRHVFTQPYSRLDHLAYLMRLADSPARKLPDSMDRGIVLLASHDSIMPFLRVRSCEQSENH